MTVNTLACAYQFSDESAVHQQQTQEHVAHVYRAELEQYTVYNTLVL